MTNIDVTIGICFALLVAIFIAEYYHLYRNKTKDKTKISFKEGLDLTELPIVTFKQGEKKLHFLLDTGSNISYINNEVLSEIEAKDLNASSSTIGVGEHSMETKHYSIKIGYRDQEFVEEFGALDLSPAFATIEAESGIKLHGILGNKFFEKYKYILDFRELIAYR